MNYKGHITVGFITTLIFLVISMQFFNPRFSLIEFGALLLISLIYSQLPDLDTQASKIRQIVTIFSIIVAIYLIYISDITKALVILSFLLLIWVMGFIKGFGHRGYVHTLPVGVVLSAPLLYFNFWFAICGLINFISHLLADKYYKGEKDKW